jgi:hypothetical protein
MLTYAAVYFPSKIKMIERHKQRQMRRDRRENESKTKKRNRDSHEGPVIMSPSGASD